MLRLTGEPNYIWAMVLILDDPHVQSDVIFTSTAAHQPDTSHKIPLYGPAKAKALRIR